MSLATTAATPIIPSVEDIVSIGHDEEAASVPVSALVEDNVDDVASTNGHRVRIQYHDEELRERCERNAHELLQTVFDDASANTNNAILARKALRYRRILQRMEENHVDVHDPSFNASACLGVEWHRVESD